MSGEDLPKVLAAGAAGLACFVLLNAFLPHFTFEGLGALNLAIEFAVVFLATSIALRVGRYVNTRMESSLKPRPFILLLGAITLLWVAYSQVSESAALGSLIVAIIGDGLAVAAVWALSGHPDLA
jgi:hypothetical protein